MANGAPTVSNGLVISGVTTSTTFSGSGASLTNLPAAQLSGTAAAINGSNITNLNASNISSGTVPTARLGSGTANSSTFLAGDSTFKTVTGTTINNNADNRVITGSGTANTLEGESGLTYSSNTLDVTNAVKLPDDGTVHYGVSDTAYVRGKDSTDGYLKLGTNGQERITVQTDGMTWLNKTRASSDGRLRFDKQEAGSCGIDLYNVGAHKAYITLDSEENLSYLTQTGTGHRFWTGGSTVRMQIDSNGYVTKPTNPSFAAMRSANGYSLNGQVFPFDTTTHNIGSHFNTSNYRFTAPVAGRYLFTFYSILNSSGQGRYEILINGAADQKGTRVHMTPTTTDWDHVSTSWILNLAANDYIQMYSHSNTGWHGNHWQRFCGHLLS